LKPPCLERPEQQAILPAVSSSQPASLLKMDVSEVETYFHSISTSSRRTSKTGNIVEKSFRFISASRRLEESLRGIASRFGRASLDRAENFHHELTTDLDRSSIRSAHPGTAQSATRQRSPASSRSAHQPRKKDAPSRHRRAAAEDRRRPKPPGLGWCLTTHFRRTFNKWSPGTPDRGRTATGQSPNKERTLTEQMPNQTSELLIS